MTENKSNARLQKKMHCKKIIDALNGKQLIYGEKVMILHAGMYAKWDNLVLTLFDPEEGPFANITVNIENLPVDRFAVDTNNFPDATDVLVQNNIAEPVGKYLKSGYCIYPIYQLKQIYI